MNYRYAWIMGVAAIVVAAASVTLSAQSTVDVDVPRLISYQGLLTSSNGTALSDGTYEITVRLYADRNGTDIVWEDTYETTVHGGVFNLYLGSASTPLPGTERMNRPLWVGTSVNGGEEMGPLTPLSASPYALNLPNKAVTSDKLADRSVTAEKVDMNYISEVNVNGVRVSGNGVPLNIVSGEAIDLDFDAASRTLKIDRAATTGSVTADPDKVGAGVLANYNPIAANGNTILGTGDYNTISGGQGNTVGVTGFGYSWGTIGGGHNNRAYQQETVVAGGYDNQASGYRSSVLGGYGNGATYSYATVGGGFDNEARSDYAIIAGGSSNFIGTGGGANFGAILGGESNLISSQYASIGGGYDNEVSGYNGTVSGGRSNTASGHTATISGGYSNTVASTESTVGGGTTNSIQVDAVQSVIAGGAYNQIQTNASISAIGGGSANVIQPAPATSTGTYGTLATIPGGDNLIAQSWAQTVIGGWNVGKGSVPFRYQGTHSKNNPIFIIGNGSSSVARSNAFEVSYNGHSIVYHENGTGGMAGPGTGVVEGGTYTDNVIYGWANVTGNGLLIGGCADFGIQSIQHTTPGVYRVTLRPVGTDGVTPATISCGAVVATLGVAANPPVPPAPPSPTPPAGLQCAQITTTNILNNVFEVYITRTNTGGGTCGIPIDMPFKFHVTGRVN